MAKMIVVDEQKCLGCKSCVIECALAHSAAGTLVEALAGEAPLQSRVHVEALGQFGMPLQCRHCEDAPCIMICPTEAIHRLSETGPVLLDKERCIGCKFCIAVCPFGVINLSREGKAVVKCDLCIERTERGEDPACVTACKTGALKFVDVDTWLADRRRRATARAAQGSARATAVASEPGAAGEAQEKR